ncbi:DHHC palmitoyltransferase-domain-containing protein [Vararia minispora EC-137]|uniref:DHHC palmitoyltransferase-domain-containing protein n=1 Tax=Vararia minispora EC-137 TaxID=1314806 RepID=A0ACB8QKT7_9AGAM|nr:DHHC palmitoyltransferase-domain-containing protein [Vararia minispora EC-137]
MAASQHSLPFSSFSSSTSTPASSRPSQLPSTLSSVGLSTRFENSSGPRLRSGSTSSHQRTGSAVSSVSRPRRASPQPLSLSADPQSPTRPAFFPSRSLQPPLSAGILPSSSFFRPAKPTSFLPDPPPRSSFVSDLPIPLEDRSGTFPLQNLAHDSAYDSDAVSDAGRASRMSSAEDGRPLPARDTSTTYSREPLIAHPRAGTLSADDHASPDDDAGDDDDDDDATTLPSAAAKRASGGTRVREGLERFRKGLSLESVRRSLGSPGPVPAASYEPKPAPPFPPAPAPADKPPRWDPRPPASPTRGPPLSATPRADGLRNYALLPSRNRWFARGRALVGGDAPWAFLGTLALILGVGGVWLGTTCVWWWRNLSPALAAVGAYMFLLCATLFFTAAFTDPGILPRDLDPDPPYPATSPSDGEPRAPYPRDIKVRAGSVRVKYCTTCRTYRPPRSSHCRICDNCVDACDHHCQWVNNCVGRRNYTYFFSLIFFCPLTLVLVIVSSAVHLWLLTQRDALSFAAAARHGAGSAVAFCVAIVIFWPVTALLGYHIRLLVLNITTIEQIRNAAHTALGAGPPPPNPFSHGRWRHNAAAVLCRPRGYTWVRAHARATEDRRAINPEYVEGVV